MAFDIPKILAPKYKKDGSIRILSRNTIKTYKSRLNKLSLKGFSNVDELIKQPTDVISEINNLCSGLESPILRQQKRCFFCAIFWVLPESILKQENQYHKAFQKVRDSPP